VLVGLDLHQVLPTLVVAAVVDQNLLLLVVLAEEEVLVDLIHQVAVSLTLLKYL
jgi:hypothetical protein